MTRSRLVAFGIAALAAVLLVAVAHHAIVSFALERTLSVATGYTIRFGDMKLDAAHATFFDLHVTERGDPLFDARRVDVDYALRDLLPGAKRLYGLEAIAVAHPVITLVRHRDGTYNIAGAPATTNAQPAIGPPLRFTARVRDGEIRFVDAAPLEADLATQSIAGVDVTAAVDSLGRTTVRLDGALLGRRTQTAPLRAYPISLRSTTDVPRGYTATRARAVQIPLRGILNFLIHARVARFDDGVMNGVNVVAYGLDLGSPAFAVQLGGGGDLADARISVGPIMRAIRDLHGHIDLFGDGVTTSDLQGSAAGIPLHVRGGLYDFAKLRFRLGIGGDAQLTALKTLFAFLAPQPVRGTMHIETLITAGVADPLIRTALSSERIDYGTIPLDRLHGIVDYEHGAVTFTGVHAGFGPVAATASGNVDVSGPDTTIESFVDAGGAARGIPYAQAIASDATIDGSGVVIGTGRGGFRVGGVIAADGPQTRGSGFVAVDERGRGEFGPFEFERRDGTALAGALRLDRPRAESAGWLDATGYRLDIPRRTATLPGLAIPVFPQVGGRIDVALVAGGPSNDFALAGHVRARRAAFQQYALGDADLDIAGTLANLRLQRIRVTGPIGDFAGNGAVTGGLFALAGSYDGSLEALAPFTGRIGARGPVRAPVLAMVDARGITVQTAAAAMRGASIRGFPIDAAAGTLQVDAGGVRIVAADAEVLGRHAVAASVDRNLAISAVGLPAAALREAGIPLDAGQVSVFGVGNFRGPVFAGSVDLEHGSAAGGYPVGGWADLDLAGPRLTIHGGMAAIGSTYARLSGGLDGIGSPAPQYDVAAAVALGDVTALESDLRLPIAGAEGSYGAHVHVTGSGGTPDLAGSLTVPEGSYNGLNFTSAAARFALAGGAGLRVRFDDGRVRVGTTPVEFAAAIAPAALSVHAASGAANLADFNDYFDANEVLAGRGTAALTFSEDDRSVRTYGRVALAGTRLERFPLGDVRAAWGMDGPLVAATFASDSPAGRLSAHGTIRPRAGAPDALLRSAIDVDVNDRDVDLATWLPALGVPYPVAGRLTAAGHVRGVFPRLAIGGTATVSGGSIGPYAVGSASVRTRILGERVSIEDANADLGFVRFTSSGFVGVGPGDRSALHVHASVPDIEVAAERLVPRDPLDVGGALEADALFTGSLAAPEVTAGFDLEHARYGQFAVTHVIGDLESDLHSVRLNSAEFAFPHGTAIVAGSLPITLSPPGIGPPRAALSLTADARDVDLAPLAPLVPGSGTKLGGTVNGRLALQGTVRSPRVFGSATLTNGSYVSNLETSPIHNFNAQLDFGGTSVALRSHGNVGTGTVDANGQLQLPLADAPPSGYSVGVVVHGAQLELPQYGGGELDGTAAIVSGVRRPTLSGDLLLYNATIPFATIFRASGAGDAETSGPPFDLGLDLHAEAGKNVRIRSSIIDVGTTGDVTLTGTLLSPRAAGQLTATRGGFFSTYNRLFRIQDAVVTFDPTQGIVPNLDLRATAHVTNPDPDTTRNAIGSADITVDVTGPADSYSVTYASQPSYSQEQIVALLAAIPFLGAVNFNQPQLLGTLRGAPGESNVLLPPGVTLYQTGVYTFQQEAFSLLDTQLTQRLLSPAENAFGGALGLSDLQLTLDYGGRVGYAARKEISAKRQIDVTLGQVLSYPVRTQFGIQAHPDAVTSASFIYFTQNGTPSYANSIFGNTENIQVLNGVQPLSNRQGFSAVITRTYP